MEEVKPNIFTKLKNLIYGFLYGFYLPLTVCIWAFVCFIFEMQDIGLFVLIAFAGLILVVHKDITPIIPILTCFFLLIRDYAPLTTLPYIVSYIFLFSCLVCHFIIFPPKAFCLGNMFFPLCLVTAALFLGGTISPYITQYKNGLVTAFTVGPMVLIIYLIFLNGVTPPKNFDLKIYLSVAIIIPTVFASLELFLIRNCESFSLLASRDSTGWGNVNHVAAMILIAFPLCAYLMCKTKRYAACLAVMLYLVIALYVTRSDGCQGILLMGIPFIALQIIIQSKHNLKQKIIVAFSIAFALISAFGIVVFNLFSINEITDFIIKATYDSGRRFLYAKAIDLFKKNPILGVGVSFIDESAYRVTNNFNFHSTFFHILATMGTAGIVAYSVYYFVQFKILLNKNSDFNTFSFISILLLESYGIIDICRFNALVYYITLITLTLELEKYKAEDISLPLTQKHKFYTPISF